MGVEEDSLVVAEEISVVEVKLNLSLSLLCSLSNFSVGGRGGSSFSTGPPDTVQGV